MGMVNLPVKPEPGKNFLVPGYFRNGIATGICLLDGSSKEPSLFPGWQQFYLPCQLHETKLAKIFIITKKISKSSLTSQQLKMTGFHAPLL
jgi:hypothetical protein